MGMYTSLVCFDQNISDLLRPGENTLCIQVATSLYNRLVQRDYYRFLGEDLELAPFDYGLTGAVSVIPYSVIKIA